MMGQTMVDCDCDRMNECEAAGRCLEMREKCSTVTEALDTIHDDEGLEAFLTAMNWPGAKIPTPAEKARIDELRCGLLERKRARRGR